jgi:hypothetical protein
VAVEAAAGAEVAASVDLVEEAAAVVALAVVGKRNLKQQARVQTWKQSWAN